jgi:mannosyltransferase OCH1-like enzyme
VRNGIATTLNKVQQRINAPNQSYRHIYMEDESINGVLNSAQRIPVTYRNMKKV